MFHVSDQTGMCLRILGSYHSTNVTTIQWHHVTGSPLAWALGLLVIPHGQGQSSHLPASGVGQVVGCDGQ